MTPGVSDLKKKIMFHLGHGSSLPLFFSRCYVQMHGGGLSVWEALEKAKGSKDCQVEHPLPVLVSGARTLDLLALLAPLSLRVVWVIVWFLPQLGLSLVALSSVSTGCRRPSLCHSLHPAHRSFLLLPAWCGVHCLPSPGLSILAPLSASLCLNTLGYTAESCGAAPKVFSL